MFEFTLACLGKEEYVCPSDAGPAWRAAHEMGHNMFELERNLLLTQEDRLDKHNKKLAEWLEFEALMAVMQRGNNLRHRWHHGRANRQS